MSLSRFVSSSLIPPRRRFPICLSPLIVFALVAVSIAQVWDHIPFKQWSDENVSKILTDSPWVSVSLAGYGTKHPKVHLPLCVRIRLLTAAPVREAYLRIIDRGPVLAQHIGIEFPLEKEISLNDLMNRGRLQRFIEDNPDDIRTKGSDKFIVLSAIEARSYGFESFDWKEESRTDLLMDLQLPDLARVTSLSTKTGKKPHLVRYEQPGLDSLGAKFYFPRLLSDGRPFVTLRDKEPRFETKIGGKKIKVKFDLKKLVYLGRLQI
ncbi:MAG TPA: hypothetical protein VE398_06645 [Acidobacteriota bacterium]|nr:hypothetical protein [Acidobacteriota bacterium]